MKRFLMAALLMLPAMGAQAETLWTGNAFVTTASTACGTSARVGDFFRAIYRPAGTGLGNGANSYLSLTSSRANFAVTVPNNTFRMNINYTGRTVGSTVSLGTHAGGILLWNESAAFATGTANITVTARFAKFFGTTDCTATVQVFFTKLP